MPPTVHTFGSTGEAYDDSQTGYLPETGEELVEVKDGDVLFVPSENAVAVMIEAWPTAPYPEYAGDHFHAVSAPDFDWTRVPPTLGGPPRNYGESRELALVTVGHSIRCSPTKCSPIPWHIVREIYTWTQRQRAAGLDPQQVLQQYR